MSWEYYVYVAIVALYVYTQIPKPKSAPRPGIDSVKVPTVDSSRDIPVIFGTVDIRSPHIAWYGDLETEAIKEKTGGK